MSSILVSRFLIRVREVGSYTMFSSCIGTFRSVRYGDDARVRVDVARTTLEFCHQEIGGATTPGSNHSHLGSGISCVDERGSCCNELDREDEREDVEACRLCSTGSSPEHAQIGELTTFRL